MREFDQPENQHSRQLPIQVNGLPLRDGAIPAYMVQAVLESLTERERRQLDRLKDLAGSNVGVIDNHFDDAPVLLRGLGFNPRPIAGEDLGESGLRIAVISCPHRHTRLDHIDVLRFLDQGGVLISSDRAIRLPGVSAFVDYLPGRPASRARLAQESGRDYPTQAPIWLDSGHVPIDPSSVPANGSSIMATNSLTGEPLVVRIPAGPGGIVHSVAHWLQVPHPQSLTSVERRRLRDVPRFRHAGNSFPGLSLGGFLAQQSMIQLLIQGLGSTLEPKGQVRQFRIERGK